VIGGGSAGAVIANRLSEVSQWNVLLLEAGGDETIVSDIPGLAKLLQRTNIDWQYKTVPQTLSCLAFNGNQLSRSIHLFFIDKRGIESHNNKWWIIFTGANGLVEKSSEVLPFSITWFM